MSKQALSYGCFIGFIVLMAVLLSVYPERFSPRKKTLADVLMQQLRESYNAHLRGDEEAAKNYASRYCRAESYNYEIQIGTPFKDASTKAAIAKHVVQALAALESTPWATAEQKGEGARLVIIREPPSKQEGSKHITVTYQVIHFVREDNAWKMDGGVSYPVRVTEEEAKRCDYAAIWMKNRDTTPLAAIHESPRPAPPLLDSVAYAGILGYICYDATMELNLNGYQLDSVSGCGGERQLPKGLKGGENILKITIHKNNPESDIIAGAKIYTGEGDNIVYHFDWKFPHTTRKTSSYQIVFTYPKQASKEPVITELTPTE